MAASSSLSLSLSNPSLPTFQYTHFTPRCNLFSLHRNHALPRFSALATQPPPSPGETPKLLLPTNQSSDRLLRIRHTCAHVMAMAMAVQKIYPQAKVTTGPWIDNGFYYDFDVEPITDQDLKKIKKEMERIIGRNLPLIREEFSTERRIMAINEPYKMEILQSIKEEPITIYHIGEEWWDLCAGPHVESTGNIHKKAVQLESVAGAYWRGDTNKPMLQRIYRTAWENEEQLKAYLHFKEEAKRRDHRRIDKYCRMRLEVGWCFGIPRVLL